MSGLSIRRYRAGDRDRVRSVMETALRATNAYFEDVPALQVGDIRETYLEAGGEFLVGTVDGDVVATGAFRPVSEHTADTLDVDESERTAELKRMHVHPDHQRRGYASELLSELETRAREAGFRTLVLETTERQDAAAAFYTSKGFELAASEPVSVAGETFDLHYYRKGLDG